MRSMTGFGHAKSFLEDLDVTVDIKSVNSRYLDLKMRLARELIHLEPLVRNLVQKIVSRGRVDLYVEVKVKSTDQFRLNVDLMKNYLAIAEEMNRAGGSGQLKVGDLIAVNGLVVQDSQVLSGEKACSTILQTVSQALESLVQSREMEGRQLRDELKARLSSLSQNVADIETGVGKIKEHYRSKLERRVRTLSTELEIDDKRLGQEIFYYIERSDVAEELCRLQGHLERSRSLLEERPEVPVGKNLDFLCQEMNREINTVLAKAAVAKVADAAIVAKAEIERIREQVQNVE